MQLFTIEIPTVLNFSIGYLDFSQFLWYNVNYNKNVST